MRLILDGGNHLHESADVVGSDLAADRALEIGEVIVHLAGDAPAFRRRRDEKRPPIVGADRPCDEAAVDQPIEDARERGSLVREAAMQVSDRRRPRRGELRQDVRLALRQPELSQISEIESDPVRGAMDVGNQAKRHRTNRLRESRSCPAAAGTRAAPPRTPHPASAF